MTDKLTCGRLSTCELCSRCLLAEMLFQWRTWLPYPSMSWVGGLTTLCDRVQSSTVVLSSGFRVARSDPCAPAPSHQHPLP